MEAQQVLSHTPVCCSCVLNSTLGRAETQIWRVFLCIFGSGSHEEDELLPGGQSFHPRRHARIRTQSTQRFCWDGGAVPEQQDQVSPKPELLTPVHQISRFGRLNFTFSVYLVKTHVNHEVTRSINLSVFLCNFKSAQLKKINVNNI